MKPEQKIDANACCMNCGNNNCCHNDFHGNSPKFILLRWLLGILILVIMFAIGFKLGEFKGGMWGNGFYGPRMMHGDVMMYGPGVYPPMVRFQKEVPEQDASLKPSTSAGAAQDALIPVKKPTTPTK